MEDDVDRRGRITVHLQEPTPDRAGVAQTQVVLSTETLGAIDLFDLLRRLQARTSAGSQGRLDADEIVPGLWQGAAPPVGRAVSEAGFTLLVLCAREIQPPRDEFPGVRVLHAPNDDAPELPPDREKLVRLAAGAVAEEVRQGGRALVTCAAGLNRSGLVTGLALRHLAPRSGMDALIERLRQRRPLALSNPFFAAWLRDLDGAAAQASP